MKFSFSNTCEICKKSKREGDHTACSKKKQALSQSKTKKSSSRTYNNPRQLSNFLKTLGQ